MLAEIGRQPWIVYGVMRTADAVSRLATVQVATSLAAFVVVYGMLGFVAISLLVRFARKGPERGLSRRAGKEGDDMLETIWFILWGVLWAVYFMLDGFDLGLGTLLPFLAQGRDRPAHHLHQHGAVLGRQRGLADHRGRRDLRGVPGRLRRDVQRAVHAADAAAVRAHPPRHRLRVPRQGGRAGLAAPRWDACFVVGSALPALLLGVAFANIFAGVPIDEEGVLQGNLLTCLNPYGLLGGVLFVLLFPVHGAIWGAGAPRAGSASGRPAHGREALAGAAGRRGALPRRELVRDAALRELLRDAAALGVPAARGGRPAC